MKSVLKLCGIVCVLNLGFFVLPAFADDQVDQINLAEAKAAYKQKDYAKALVVYKTLAEKGNPTAQYELAEMYRSALGVNRDLVEAMKWYRLASAQNHLKATYALGYLYHEQAQDTYDEALVWYKRAAQQGEVLALLDVATIYENIKGDVTEAIKWYQRSIDKYGQPFPSTYSLEALQLANIYYQGRGVAQDFVLARKWYEAAAVSGDPRAQLMLGNIYHYGQGVKPSYVKAKKWYQSAAIQGDDLIIQRSAKNRLKELAIGKIR